MRKLESIYIYPDYNDRNILHDIALAKLDRPFDMDTFTASVCMPPKLDLFADKEEIGKKTLFFPSSHLCFLLPIMVWREKSSFSQLPVRKSTSGARILQLKLDRPLQYKKCISLT